MNNKIILISGIPGTGKTTISKELGKRFKWEVISIGKFVIENNLIISKDNVRDTFITNEKKLISQLKKVILKSSETIVIEGHFVDIIPNKFVDIIIILRTHPYILEKRLYRKNYSRNKVNENVSAEILGICTANALNRYPKNKIFELDTSNLSIENTLNLIEKIILKRPIEFSVGRIDWLCEMKDNVDLERFFNY